MDKRNSDFQSGYASALDSPNPEEAFLSLARQFPDLWCDLAAKVAAQDEEFALKHFDVALAATEIAPIKAMALNEIGRIFANRGQNREALEYFHKANDLNPKHPSIMANIGLALRWSGDLTGAKRWLDRALTVNPWEHSAQFERAFVHLLGGNYTDGFEEYEARWRSPNNNLKKLECKQPEWRGETSGKLFVYGEQGTGDIFLMLRYARLIHAMGLHQTWVVHTSMKPLVDLIPEIDCVMVSGLPAPDFDYHIPAVSLPRIFKTQINTIPDAAIIPKVAPKDYGPGFHVGIVWRGSRMQLNDKIRSTNLEQWRPVLNVPGVVFHSLQVDGSEEALVYPEIQVDKNATDWVETASRVCGLDLVISVDTSVMHLCGSIGIECWCAMHARPYFVFPLGMDNTPWYPSVRLFKQPKEFEWKPVFESIAKALYERTNPV